jgi:hypothetical protein
MQTRSDAQCVCAEGAMIWFDKRLETFWHCAYSMLEHPVVSTKALFGADRVLLGLSVSASGIVYLPIEYTAIVRLAQDGHQQALQLDLVNEEDYCTAVVSRTVALFTSAIRAGEYGACS